MPPGDDFSRSLHLGARRWPFWEASFLRHHRARIACLSSFYRFLIRMDIVASNPYERLERPKVVVGPQ